MADIIKSLAIEQRKRLVASLMSYSEQSSWWAKLTSVEQREMRKKVLDSVGTYHDFILDVVKVSNEDSMVNEQALTLIQQVHAGQARLERALGQR
jgi:hypothetical protein